MTKPFDFMAEAQVTLSNQFHGDMVPLHAFQANMLATIELIERLDQFKKTLFYGRALPGVGVNYPAEGFKNCAALPGLVDGISPERGEAIIHAIVGKVTEAGELLKLLQETLFCGVPFDEVNFIEEIGDGQWYDAIGLNAVQCTFEDCQRTNIAKLRERFRDKFTEYDANNRDLFAERLILEGSADKTACFPSHSKYEACHNCDGVHFTAHNTLTDVREYAATVGKPYCEINNWMRVGNCLLGDVIGHHRIGDQADARTSAIIGFDEAKGICETRNTVYKLGPPYRATPLMAEAKAVLDKA